MPQKIRLHSVLNGTPKWQWTTGKIMRKSLLRNSQRLGQMVFWVKNVSIPAHKKPTTTLPPLLFSSKWPKMRSNMSLMASSFEKLSLTTMISFSIFCFSSNGQVQFHLAVVKWCLLAKEPCTSCGVLIFWPKFLFLAGDQMQKLKLPLWLLYN